MKAILGTLSVLILLPLADSNLNAQQGPPRGRGREGVPEMFRTNPLPKDERERKVLEVLERMSREQRQGNLLVPATDGRILRVLAESIGAKHVVELGTSIGYSGTWFCLALERTGGKLTTFEIDAGRAAKARENFKAAGVDQMVTLVEGDAHDNVLKIDKEIDLLFLDADKEGYLDYLKKLLPKVRPGGLIVAHNIDERMAHPPFIQAITTDPSLETVFLNLQTSGISVSLKKR